MSDRRVLYEQVILDHNRSPRNFGVLEEASHKAEGYNPLCGDQFTVYLKLKDGYVEDIHFDGAGCAISKSAASVMTTLVKGKTREQVKELFNNYHEMVTAEPDAELDEDTLGKLMVFSGVRRYPIRIKCATLAWHTMVAAFDDTNEAVSTE